MEYLKRSPRTENQERGIDLYGKPMTQKADRPRASYGSLLMSAQTVEGLCTWTRKCVRRVQHEGACWPE